MTRPAMTVQRKAVVLLSGGLDSTTVLAIAMREGYVPYALSFRYGQRHTVELDAAATGGRRAQGVARHVVADIDLRVFGGSALTADIAVPHHDSADDLDDGIPSPTCRPATRSSCRSRWPGPRSWAPATSSSASTPWTTAATPTAGRSTSRAYEQMANLATKAGVEGRQQLKIHTPLIELTKAQIIERGLELGVDYALTHSCYDPARRAAPAARCDSCLLRARGFAELGLTDPALAVAGRAA